MADSVRDAIDSIRGKLQAELDAQLGVLADRQASELAAARSASEAELEGRIAAIKAASEEDVQRRLAEARAAADAELETRLAAVKAEADADATRRVSAAETAALAPGSLAHAFREIDAAGSVSDILHAIERAVSGIAARAALFVGQGKAIERWSGGSHADLGPGTAVADAVRTAQQVRVGNALILPLVLDGTAVGAVEVELAETQVSATIESIVWYGSTRLSAATALRTAQAGGWLANPRRRDETARAGQTSEGTTGPVSAPAPPTGAGGTDIGQAASRYARLLVSEIKLYNEAAVREGREHRDLSRRLATEIERARRTYDERVPSTVPDRSRYFHNELVQILAGGDPSLLG